MEGFSLFALSVHATLWLSLTKRPVIFSSNKAVRYIPGGKTQEGIAKEYYDEATVKATEMKVVSALDAGTSSQTKKQIDAANERLERIVRGCP